MIAPRVYRGAILGAGNIARSAHLPAFAASPRLRERVALVAAVDPRPAIEPLEGIPIVPRIEDLARLGPIDFVDVCTATSSHVALTLRALEAGHHVLCEKPVAVDRGEAERIARAARASGRVVVPCHQYRYNPAWRQARAWLEAGRIGRWHAAEIAVVRAHADPGAAGAAGAWRGRGAESRGGVLVDHGTHWIYLIQDLAGPPAGVRAWTATLRHAAYDVEDTVHLLLEYPDRVVTLFLTWAGWGRETSIRFLGERGTVAWVGGELTLDSETGSERRDMSHELQKSSYPSWFADLFERFVDCMDAASGQGPSPAGEAALSDVASVAGVLERAYASAVTEPRERASVA